MTFFPHRPHRSRIKYSNPPKKFFLAEHARSLAEKAINYAKISTKFAKQAQICVTDVVKSESQADCHAINASEIAACTAVIAAGFFFNRFWFLVREKKSFFANAENVINYALEIDKLIANVEVISVIVVIVASILSFGLFVLRTGICNVFSKIKCISELPRRSRQIIGGTCILIGIAIAIIGYFVPDKLANAIYSYVTIISLFILFLSSIMYAKLTLLARYLSFYMTFCVFLPIICSMLANK